VAYIRSNEYIWWFSGKAPATYDSIFMTLLGLLLIDSLPQSVAAGEGKDEEDARFDIHWKCALIFGSYLD
jgi:hypothetical protein